MHPPEDSLDKVWESFYKIGEVRMRSLGGTGLGLFRAIQEAHKNEYGVANVEGDVEFWIEIDIGD